MSTDGRDQKDLRARIADLRETNAYLTERAIDSVTEAVFDRMLELGLSRAEFAERLGVTPARITNILRGDNNFTIRTLIDVSAALDCDLAVSLAPHAEGRQAHAKTSPPEVAAEARTAYRVASRNASYTSRDGEIREHLLSGKLKVEGDRVYMLHESDKAYRLARFRQSGTHSTQVKTNVGRHAYYRNRILIIARDIASSC